MRRAWLLLLGGLVGAQVEMPDSLARLFERDINFDIVVGRSFPVVTGLTDTFPVVPLLSGSSRVGISWRWGMGRKAGGRWLLTFSPLFLFEKITFRATGASVVPGVELVPAAIIHTLRGPVPVHRAQHSAMPLVSRAHSWTGLTSIFP